MDAVCGCWDPSVLWTLMMIAGVREREYVREGVLCFFG
jgi:hypothetical protein